MSYIEFIEENQVKEGNPTMTTDFILTLVTWPTAWFLWNRFVANK